MRKVALAVVLILTFSLSSTFLASANEQPRKIFTGWIPYYSMKTSLPAALDNADLIREVMPFWYTLRFDGKKKSAVIADLYAPANPSIPIATPLGALRGAGFSIIPTITDGTAKLVLSGLLKNPTSRAQVVNVIMDLVRSNNFDGIDLDFEGFAFVDGNSTWKETAPGWIALVRELSMLLHAENKLLSVSTPFVLDPEGPQRGYFVYSWADIAPYIDKLRIMTYDYSVSKVGPIGPISWTERTLKYAVSIMPASKVFVGVPGYGRDWVTAVSGICPANVAKTVKPGAKAATFVMRNAATLAATYAAVPVYNEVHGETTFSYQKVYNGQTAGGLATTCTASRTVWYQDARGWALRASLVTKYRIGGIAAWTIGMHEPLAMESIRQIAKEIAPDEVIAEATIDRTAVPYGTPITVSANFFLKDRSPVANLPIRIEGKSPVDGTWRQLALATTDINGRVEKAILIGQSLAIRAFSDSSWERSEGASSPIDVTVLREVAVNAPGTARSTEAIAISGFIRPRAAGVGVQLERLVGKEWRPLAASTNTDELGNFTITLATQSRGVLALRVAVPADAIWAATSSPTFNIIIR